MRIPVLLAFVLCACSLGAQDNPTTLTGTWKFNSRSEMVLAEKDSVVTGTWQESVGGERCPVKGKDVNGIINLSVSCTSYHYNLKLEGLASLTNNSVRGKTLQNDIVPGEFTMERK